MKKKLWSRIVFVLVVALLVAAWIILTSSGERPDPPAAGHNRDASTKPAQPSTEMPAADESTADAPTEPEAPADSEPEPDKIEVTIICQTVWRDGEVVPEADAVPVVGAEISIRLAQGESVDEASFQTSGRSDSQGRITLSLPRSTLLAVTVESADWSLFGGGREPRRSLNWMFDEEGEAAVRTLSLTPLNSARIRVEYEDGHPYGGSLVIRTAKQPRMVQSLYYSGAPIVTYLSPTLATGTELMIRLEGRRQGFVRVHEHPFTVSRGSISVNVSIARADADDDSPAGVLEIDLSGFRDDAEVSVVVGPASNVRLERMGLGRYSERGVDTRYPYRTTLLAPGAYRVSVQGPGLDGKLRPRTVPQFASTWTAEFEILDGQDTRLQATPTRSSAATVRVLGPDQEPLVGAVLTTSTSGTIRWLEIGPDQAGQSLSGSTSYAVTDEAGIATVYGIMRLDQPLRVAAQGYETQEVRAVFQAGQITDLGTVTMQKAYGTIRIVIQRDDGVEDARYRLLVLRPGASTIMAPIQFTGNSHELTGLDLQNYTLSLSALDDDVVTSSKNLVLTVAEPDVEVTFQMRPRG